MYTLYYKFYVHCMCCHNCDTNHCCKQTIRDLQCVQATRTGFEGAVTLF